MGDHFFRPFFELLVGTDYVRKMIKDGKSAEEIKKAVGKAMWKGSKSKGSPICSTKNSHP